MQFINVLYQTASVWLENKAAMLFQQFVDIDTGAVIIRVYQILRVAAILQNAVHLFFVLQPWITEKARLRKLFIQFRILRHKIAMVVNNVRIWSLSLNEFTGTNIIKQSADSLLLCIDFFRSEVEDLLAKRVCQQ